MKGIITSIAIMIGFICLWFCSNMAAVILGLLFLIFVGVGVLDDIEETSSNEEI